MKSQKPGITASAMIYGLNWDEKVFQHTVAIAMKNYRVLIFDWGDTIMRDSPHRTDAMYLWPSVEVVEGAEEVLRSFHNCKTIALATNAAQSDDAMIRKALARVNLESYFSKSTVRKIQATGSHLQIFTNKYSKTCELVHPKYR